LHKEPFEFYFHPLCPRVRFVTFFRYIQHIHRLCFAHDVAKCLFRIFSSKWTPLPLARHIFVISCPKRFKRLWVRPEVGHNLLSTNTLRPWVFGDRPIYLSWKIWWARLPGTKPCSQTSVLNGLFVQVPNLSAIQVYMEMQLMWVTQALFLIPYISITQFLDSVEVASRSTVMNIVNLHKWSHDIHCWMAWPLSNIMLLQLMCGCYIVSVK
jgi:hypothetical protein